MERRVSPPKTGTGIGWMSLHGWPKTPVLRQVTLPASEAGRRSAIRPILVLRCRQCGIEGSGIGVGVPDLLESAFNPHHREFPQHRNHCPNFIRDLRRAIATAVRQAAGLSASHRVRLIVAFGTGYRHSDGTPTFLMSYRAFTAGCHNSQLETILKAAQHSDLAGPHQKVDGVNLLRL